MGRSVYCPLLRRSTRIMIDIIVNNYFTSIRNTLWSETSLELIPTITIVVSVEDLGVVATHNQRRYIDWEWILLKKHMPFHYASLHYSVIAFVVSALSAVSGHTAPRSSFNGFAYGHLYSYSPAHFLAFWDSFIVHY